MRPERILLAFFCSPREPNFQMQRQSPWQAAYADAIERDNAEPLRRLLNGDDVLDTDGRELLASLLERRELRRVRGRPKAPIYRLSDIETRISRAKRSYRVMRKRGWAKEEALEAASDARKLRVADLEAAMDHTRGRPAPRITPGSLNEAALIQPWVKAAKAFDDRNDVRPLIAILRGNTATSLLVSHLFADLFQRYRLAKFRDSRA